jgi:hypothetical protein
MDQIPIEMARLSRVGDTIQTLLQMNIVGEIPAIR